jgi:DNA repair exonuclease SbcCD nuclease subunit
VPEALTSFCFVHAADLHLDTPFHGIHDLAPEVGEALREASLDAFDSIVDVAISREAAFVVLAGDIYDGEVRGLRAQLRFRDGLRRLSEHGIATFVVHGNHDPVETGWSAIGSWPELVTVFASDAVDVVPVRRDGEVIATVQGISYPTREVTENLARRFSRPDTPAFHVGVLHCNVQGTADGYANYSPCSIEDLRATGLDYLALGHIHQRRVLAGREGYRDPFIVYPGNSQARSPRSSEREAKGAYVVHIEQGVVERLEFVACDRVRFVDIECALESITDVGDLEDRLCDLGREALQDADGRSVVVRARLVGRGPLHADLARVGYGDELLRRLRELSPSYAPFLWWDEVIDESLAERDLDALSSRGDFASDLLNLARSVCVDPDELSDLRDRLVDEAPKMLQADVMKILEDDETLARMIDRARLVALDQLGDDR